MSKKLKVIVVDDHKMFRDGLRFVLTQGNDIEIIAEAANGIEFLELMETHKPDIVLMDISMPEMDGIEATAAAIKKFPKLNIIALTMYGDEEYYSKMIFAGARGFVLKQSSSNELVQAILTVHNGDNFFSQELMKTIILNIGGTKKFTSNIVEPAIKLTSREADVIQLLCAGFTNVDIAEKLHLSIRTVEGHKSNLLTKTGSKNTVSLVMYSLKHKLVKFGE